MKWKSATKRNNRCCECTASYIAEHVAPLSITQKHINYVGALFLLDFVGKTRTYKVVQESGSLTEVFIDGDHILLIRPTKEKQKRVRKNTRISLVSLHLCLYSGKRGDKANLSPQKKGECHDIFFSLSFLHRVAMSR